MNVLTTLVLPFVTALVTGGLIVGLLRIKPERRQINAGAGKDEATTADILTGTALKMVQHAEDEAQRAKAEAISAREEATTARKRAEDAEQNAAESARTSVECAAEIMRMSSRVRQYEDYIITNGLPLPNIA